MAVNVNGSTMFTIEKGLKFMLLDGQKQFIAESIKSEGPIELACPCDIRRIRVKTSKSGERYLEFQTFEKGLVTDKESVIAIGRDAHESFSLPSFTEFAFNYQVTRNRSMVALNNHDDREYLQLFLQDEMAKAFIAAITFGRPDLVELERIESEDAYTKALLECTDSKSDLANYLCSDIDIKLPFPRDLGQNKHI